MNVCCGITFQFPILPNDGAKILRRYRSVTFVAGTLACCLGQASIAAEPARVLSGAPRAVAPDAVRLVLPVQLPAAVGIECNVYFDNVVLAARSDHLMFDVVCAKGMQLEERWTWTPTEADVGSHPFELIIRDEQNRRIASRAALSRSLRQSSVKAER